MKVHKLFVFLLLLSVGARAQNYWEAAPAFSTNPYTTNDVYLDKLQAYTEQIDQKMQAEKQKAEQKIQAMSEQERMQLALKASMRYQTMKPEEIMKMQQESQEIMALQAEMQQKETDFDARFNEIQKAMEDELNKALGPIEAEYNKLPDGEGTPDWAIEKAKQLYKQYNQKYETVCAKYVTGPNALFVKWLQEYKTYLIQSNLPFQIKYYAYQSNQSGMPPMSNAYVEMDVVKRYLDRCKTVFNYRKPSPR